MSENKTIVPNDKNLSLDAYGLLSTMLNVPERDYLKVEELCVFFEGDSLKTIRTALTELENKGYVICVNGKYAVKKQSILEMQTM